MKPSENDRFQLHYEQGMLRSAFRSMFWAIISERKKAGRFSLKDFIALLPRGDKGKVSKWFNGDPNWTINTIGTIARALNVDIKIEAVDRTTGVIFTPTGIQTSAMIAKAVRPADLAVTSNVSPSARNVRGVQAPPETSAIAA